MDEPLEEETIEHIGIKRKSGRYPWGSGNNPYQRSVGFKSYLDEMRNKGLSESQIAKGVEDYVNAGRKEGEPFVSFKTTDLRAAIGNSRDVVYAANQATAQRLAAKGLSNGAIAERMGLSRSAESTVRGWLKTGQEINEKSVSATADRLREHVATKKFVDVGAGTELYMGIAKTKLNVAVASLRDEGYQLFPLKVPQLGTDKNTELKVLGPPGTTWHDAKDALNRGEVFNITDHSPDGGQTYYTPRTLPTSVNPKRVEVRYADDGGDKMDGVIELRPGVDDLSLGASKYAQVRVAVGGTHFLKGMAIYSNDLPPGVDIRFNTNKTKAQAPDKLDAMKPLKRDKEDNVDANNPFGATTYPRMYGAAGKEKQSPLNIVGSKGAGNIEGRWDEWARALSSQFLSKQPVTLAATQLGKARQAKRDDLDEILSLNNEVVKKKLLDEYADSADAAAVHLKARAFLDQATAVILPMNSMRPGEIFAPNHTHGDKVVLVRHPHGGPFEIPELTVNNLNRTARAVLGGAKDAVGIHHSVAAQLSGADFDGDTVLVIPNNNRAVKARPPLAGLKDFDAKRQYTIDEGDTKTSRMTKKNTQTEMGKISNLITDMSIHGANDDELARAIRHSMVVIDAEKHGLNYKQSAIDNNIAELKERYQPATVPGKRAGGASTLISRASSGDRVPERKYLTGARGVDAKTGERLYVETGLTRTNTKTGKEEPRITKGSRMDFVKDARDLLSSKKNPQPMEEVYASHANAMKALANEARKVGHPDNLKMPRQSKAARNLYANEVASLNAKLKIALRNAPIERRAQILGNAMARARIDADHTLDKDDIKKIKYQELERARLITGASKIKIGSDDHEHALTAREWEAIQAGAVSATHLRAILANADIERVRSLATPRASTTLTPGQLARARALANSGRPISEIAEKLGIPRSTLSDNLAAK